MRRGVLVAVFSFLIVLFASLSMGHGGEEMADVSHFLEDYWGYFMIGVSLLFLIVLIIDGHIQEPHAHKRFCLLAFVVICVVVLSVTGYILFDTMSKNIFSWSKGPVHWHADLEIFTCGQERHFDSPESKLLNRVGSASVHHHDDMRIHLEGVLMNREQATLGYFFDTIDVPFSSDRIFEYRNGDSCPDGKTGKVRMYINGVENFEFREYVIAPYPDVPPGDRIKITFD